LHPRINYRAKFVYNALFELTRLTAIIVVSDEDGVKNVLVLFVLKTTPFVTNNLVRILELLQILVRR
jgi:hypothetical protein